MKVATSIAIGRKATSELATKAVTQAMKKANITMANSVLLFLSSEFACDPQPAIRAAAKAGQCTQIFGCSATGIFTEDDWVLDAPAAAAMVFGGDVRLQLANLNSSQQPLLTLTAPNAINSTWLNSGDARYGGVSGDAIGQGPFSVWQNGKGHSAGHIEAFFEGVNLASKASHGLKVLSKPKNISETNGYDLVLLDNKSPYLSLKKAWGSHCKSEILHKNKTSIVLPQIPSHLMMALVANSSDAIMNGNYTQANIISMDEDSGHITLAQPLESGQFLSWGLRDKNEAEKDLLLTIQELTQTLKTPADFGLLFSCLGRGPFYDGIDHDLKGITKALPNMPLLGFYGNGEIATIGEKNQLLPYSAVLTLFSAQA